jgi:transcriptional regulator with XRE-family HTH domain
MAARKTTDALKILDRMIGSDPKVRRQIEEERLNLEIASMIYEARTAAPLTQQRLADLVGTTQSVIARLEDADYEGHSLSMLQRIAAALRMNLEVRFVPGRRRGSLRVPVGTGEETLGQKSAQRPVRPTRPSRRALGRSSPRR